MLERYSERAGRLAKDSAHGIEQTTPLPCGYARYKKRLWLFYAAARSIDKRGSSGFELLTMSDDPSRPTAATPSARKPLTPAAERALAEAEARRQAAAANANSAPNKPAPKEYQGPKGPEPTRYGDWENKGIASDF